MLDLLTAGTLASLPLSIQTPLFARVRSVLARRQDTPQDLRVTSNRLRVASNLTSDCAPG